MSTISLRAWFALKNYSSADVVHHAILHGGGQKGFGTKSITWRVVSPTCFLLVALSSCEECKEQPSGTKWVCYCKDHNRMLHGGGGQFEVVMPLSLWARVSLGRLMKLYKVVVRMLMALLSCVKLKRSRVLFGR